MKRKSIIAFVLALALCAASLTGCRESERVSYNVSKEADNFNVVRRLTVINCRTDTVQLQMTGTFSISTDSDGDLTVICELPGHTYQKHFIHLNSWETYIVEQISESEVSKYSYELNFLPQMIPGVKITANN